MAARRCDLEMDVENPRNSSGVVRLGRRSFAIHGGTLRIMESSAPSSCRPRSKSSATARSPSKRTALRRSPNRTGDPRAARKPSAGSMKLLARPWAANSGWQALPPAARVSRSKAAVSAAELSGGIGIQRARSRAGARAARKAGPRSASRGRLSRLTPSRTRRAGRDIRQAPCRAHVSFDRTATMGYGLRSDRAASARRS